MKPHPSRLCRATCLACGLGHLGVSQEPPKLDFARFGEPRIVHRTVIQHPRFRFATHWRRLLELLGIYALGFELLESFYNNGLILFIGYAVPLILVVENERVCLALLDEVGDENGEKILALLGVLGKVFVKELGEASLCFS